MQFRLENFKNEFNDCKKSKGRKNSNISNNNNLSNPNIEKEKDSSTNSNNSINTNNNKQQIGIKNIFFTKILSNTNIGIEFTKPTL